MPSPFKTCSSGTAGSRPIRRLPSSTSVPPKRRSTSCPAVRAPSRAISRMAAITSPSRSSSRSVCLSSRPRISSIRPPVHTPPALCRRRWSRWSSKFATRSPVRFSVRSTSSWRRRGEERIARVYLTGGTANVGQLAAAIERRSRVSTEVIQPLERIGVDEKHIDRHLLTQRAAQLSVALGLAMRKSKEKRA